MSDNDTPTIAIGGTSETGSPRRTTPRLPYAAQARTRGHAAKQMENTVKEIDEKTTALQADVVTLQRELTDRIRQVEERAQNRGINQEGGADITDIQQQIVNIDSMASSAIMANSMCPNAPALFSGYENMDTDLWFTKLEAFLALKRIPQDQHLSCLMSYLDDSVLYAVADLHDDKKKTFKDLKTTIKELYATTPGLRVSLSAEL
jgi:hypothetical protein